MGTGRAVSQILFRKVSEIENYGNTTRKITIVIWTVGLLYIIVLSIHMIIA